MLSILIPTYNYNCFTLVQELHYQASELDVEFEIIVIDDCSTTNFEKHTQIAQLNNCAYTVLSQNIGRAKIRNLLAQKAKFDKLLFIDCDAQIVNDNFLQRYLSFCQETCVVCGGLEYDATNSTPVFQLRLQYGLKREARNAMQRQLHPYGAFSSFNFLISKSIFDKIKFNEDLKNYGHEDTLFGFELQKERASIYHIENSLRHVGLEEAPVFIEKTKQGIENLLYIYKECNNSALDQEIKLLKMFNKVDSIGLKPILAALYTKHNKNIELKLSKSNPSLFLFDLYKLAYLCKIAQ